MRAAPFLSVYTGAIESTTTLALGASFPALSLAKTDTLPKFASLALGELESAVGVEVATGAVVAAVGADPEGVELAGVFAVELAELVATGEVTAMVSTVNDSPDALAVNCPLAILQVIGLALPLTYRSILLNDIFIELVVPAGVDSVKSGKFAENVPVPLPDQLPVTMAGEAFEALLVETILFTVMPFGDVLVDDTLVTAKLVPADTLLGAVAAMVIPMPAHLAFVVYVVANASLDCHKTVRIEVITTNSAAKAVLCFICLFSHFVPLYYIIIRCL